MLPFFFYRCRFLATLPPQARVAHPAGDSPRPHIGDRAVQAGESCLMWLAIGAAKMPRMVSAGGPILWVCFGFPPIVQCFFLPSAVSFIPFQGRPVPRIGCCCRCWFSHLIRRQNGCHSHLPFLYPTALRWQLHVYPRRPSHPLTAPTLRPSLYPTSSGLHCYGCDGCIFGAKQAVKAEVSRSVFSLFSVSSLL